MNTTRFSNAAANVIEAFGTTAHSAIDAYRAGGERLGEFAGQRWNSAFRKASPELTAETRRNAARARKVVGSYYSRGLQVSASGAEVAVDTAVQVAGSAVERACAFAQERGARTA
jgi:hypothetical protein